MEIKSMASAHRKIEQLQRELDALTARVEALESRLPPATRSAAQDRTT